MQVSFQNYEMNIIRRILKKRTDTASLHTQLRSDDSSRDDLSISKTVSPLHRRFNRVTSQLSGHEAKSHFQSLVSSKLQLRKSPKGLPSSRPYLMSNLSNRGQISQLNPKYVNYKDRTYNSKKRSVKNFSQPKKAFPKKKKSSRQTYKIKTKTETFQNMTINIRNEITANHCNFFQIPTSPNDPKQFSKNNHSPRHMLPREVFSQRDIPESQNLYKNSNSMATGGAEKTPKMEGFLYKSHHPELSKEQPRHEIGQLLSMRSPVLRRPNPVQQLKSSKSLKHTKSNLTKPNKQNSKKRSRIGDQKKAVKKKSRKVPKILKSLNSFEPYKEEHVLVNVPAYQRKKFLNSRSQERFKTMGDYTRNTANLNRNHIDYTGQFQLNAKILKLMKRKINYAPEVGGSKISRTAFMTKEYRKPTKTQEKEDSGLGQWELGTRSQIHYSSAQTPNVPIHLSNRKKSTIHGKKRRIRQQMRPLKSVLGKFSEGLAPLSVNAKSDKYSDFSGKFSRLFDINSTRGRLNSKTNFSFNPVVLEAKVKKKKKEASGPAKGSRDKKTRKGPKQLAISLFGKKDGAFLDFEMRKTPVNIIQGEMIFSKMPEGTLDFRKKKLNFEKKRKIIAANHKKSGF